MYMTCFARLCECIPCFARKYYIYIYICPALQGWANVFPALQGNLIYIYIYTRLCECIP